MTNKKLIILTLSTLLIIGLIFLIKNTTKKEISATEKIINSYSDFNFENINYNNSFTNTTYQIDYNYSKTSINMNINDETLLVSIVNGHIHFFYNGINLINKEIDGAIKIMEYKSCNCDNKCLYLIVLTDMGYIYYVNIYDNVNNLDNITFNKLEKQDPVIDLGYIKNLDKISSCGVNAIGLKTITSEIIIDDEFKNFNQEYYRTIGDIYIYNDGTLKIKNQKELNEKVVLIFISENDYYFISKDGYLYRIDKDFNLKKLSDKKALKIGNKETTLGQEIIVILEDGIAKKYNIKNNLIIR